MCENDDCHECDAKVPENKYGVPSQAGIFVLSLTRGVVVSNFKAPLEKVKLMLEQKFGDKFRVTCERVKKPSEKVPPLWLWYFEVL